jgi:hypothetical protein
MSADRDSPFRDPALWLSDQPVTITVRGISMVPFLEEGDRVEVILARSDDFSRGDLVVFLRGAEVVVHRFLAFRDGLFLEKGDGQGRGNWAPWPAAPGRVVAFWKQQERCDLAEGSWPQHMAALGRTQLRAHRASAFAEKLPGTLLPRVFLRLCQPRRGGK